MKVPDKSAFLEETLDGMVEAGLVYETHRDAVRNWLHTVWLAAQGKPFGPDADPGEVAP